MGYRLSEDIGTDAKTHKAGPGPSQRRRRQQQRELRTAAAILPLAALAAAATKLRERGVTPTIARHEDHGKLTANSLFLIYILKYKELRVKINATFHG